MTTESRKTSVEDRPTNRVQQAAQAYVPGSNGRVWPGSDRLSSDRLSMGRRLDVDAVLKRSVRKVVTE